jgi:hypothetical protein
MIKFTPPEDEPLIIDPELLRWATPVQRQALESVALHGPSIRGAETKLGLSKDSLGSAIRRLKAYATSKGYSPEHDMFRIAPDPFNVSKVSTFYSRTETTPGQWVQLKPRSEYEALLREEAVRAFMEGYPSILIPTFDVPNPSTDEVPWIQIGDAHIGMLANEAESGSNFNIDIAKRELCAAFKLIIDKLEPCERLVINDLGDSTHFENTEKKTSVSRHDLDGERPRLMIRAVSSIMRFVINLALTKAKYVDVIINQGNHSRFGDFWLNEMLTIAYEGTDRVNIIDNENVFIGYRMGKTLVMIHHSDKCPVDRLADVMIADFKQDFAETDFHYIDIGHIHHKMTSKEKGGIVVESWNTLARGDKWHKDSGYRARQSMSVVVRSRTYGEVWRRILPIQMVYDAITKGHQSEGIDYTPAQRRAFTV